MAAYTIWLCCVHWEEASRSNSQHRFMRETKGYLIHPQCSDNSLWYLPPPPYSHWTRKLTYLRTAHVQWDFCLTFEVWISSVTTTSCMLFFKPEFRQQPELLLTTLSVQYQKYAYQQSAIRPLNSCNGEKLEFLYNHLKFLNIWLLPEIQKSCKVFHLYSPTDPNYIHSPLCLIGKRPQS